MNEMDGNNQLFKHFPFCFEAIAVTFQQANRPFGYIKEGKFYVSGKHKLYGFKVEFALRPNGFASAFSKRYPGSTSDLSIMRTVLEIQSVVFKNGPKRTN